MVLNAQEILKFASKIGASDVHFTVGMPPFFRLHGTLLSVETFAGQNPEGLLVTTKLTPADTDNIACQLMDETQYKGFKEIGDYDFSYSIVGMGRFRVNVFKQRGSTALAIRLIREKIPTIEELGLPHVVVHLTRRPRGLVLVTGPTGSGKSTTLAAMIDLINREQQLHIITLEDPIEYLHRHGKSVVNQREIGSDSQSFAKALRAAMREDPDVILVGEMRDLETIATAITAGETGHLVLATLHTTSAAQTIERIVDVFPPHQQQQIRIQLSNTLQGVIAQQLLPRIDRQGRVAALEIMLATPAVRNLIREGKTHQIISQLQTGGKFGMQTMDMALRNLFKAGIISHEEAMNRANDSDALTRMLI